MIRAARTGDEAAHDAFLAHHAETSMFLRANLRRFGLFDRSHPNATAYFVVDQGSLRAVLGRSNGGFLLIQAPQATPDFFAAGAAACRAYEAIGFQRIGDYTLSILQSPVRIGHAP